MIVDSIGNRRYNATTMFSLRADVGAPPCANARRCHAIVPEVSLLPAVRFFSLKITPLIRCLVTSTVSQPSDPAFRCSCQESTPAPFLWRTILHSAILGTCWLDEYLEERRPSSFTKSMELGAMVKLHNISRGVVWHQQPQYLPIHWVLTRLKKTIEL